MLKTKKFKLLTVILTVAVAGSIFAGCGKKEAAKTAQAVKVNLGADPKTIDPGLNTSVEGSTVIANAFEGLMNLDANDQPIPGVAEKYEVSSDGLKYTFHLRKDAKWSDGQTVKAGDFEYAWKRALDPAVASEYAYQLFYLKNGEAFNSNKAKKDDVGVKVIDDSTLEVTLEGPTPYFLALMAFPTYMPVRKDVVEKDPTGWSTKAATYISNGAFKLTAWNPKDKMTFVKNDNYWNKANVKLDNLDYTLLDQETSYMSAFTSGQVDFVYAPPTEQIPTLLKNGTAKIYPNLGTYYYSFNVSKDAEKYGKDAAKVLKDVRVRKAINLAIDRKSIVENVSKGGQLPATSFVPKGIKENASTDFKAKDYLPATANVDEAKKLLAEAGYPEGKGFPALEILYNTGQGHQDIATAVQDMLKKNLGINVTLKNVERKVQLDMTNKKTYSSVARNGWSADYADPMTFLDMWTSTSGNNVSGYSNAEYDKLITQAKSELDPAKRMGLLHKAEDLLMTDLPIMPIYEYTYVICIKDYVKGVRVSPLGQFYFQNAYIQK